MAESYTTGYPTNNQSESTAGKTFSNQSSATTVDQPKKKSSSVVYWVLGGVSVLVFLFIFLMAGVLGIYFYTQRTKNTIYTEKYPQPAIKPAAPTNQPKTDSGISNETIKAVFQVKSRVGKFTLVKMLDDKKDKYFLTSGAEVTAVYSSSQKNQNVIIAMAAYSLKTSARTEFVEMIKAEKKIGAKMFSDVREDEKTIVASFQAGKLFILTFCKFSNDSFTPCYRVVSSNRTTVADFYDVFFTK